MAQGVDERVEPTVSGRFDAMEALLAVVIFGIDAIEKQRVKMDIKIQCRAEALDKRHRICLYSRLGVAATATDTGRMQPRNLWHSLAVDGTYTFGYQARHQVAAGAQHRVFLQVNPYDGKVLRTAYPRTLPLASRLSSQYLQPLIFGEFAGLPSCILWCVGGFVRLLLSITGLKIWLNRRARPVRS